MSAFSVFRDRRTKKTAKETPTVEKHYLKLASRTALLRYILLIFLIVFAVYSFSFHGDDITMENFRYMLKFINLGDEAETPEGSVLTFDASDGNRGMIFKGDLCVLNESGVTVTGWDGDVLVKGSFGYDHPKMTQNGINLFCYDLGGSELSVFNSYSQVFGQKYDYPIYGVAASKSGSYAVISSEKGYRSAVFVYDQHFRETFKHAFGKRYSDFVAINDSGDEILVLSHYSQNGHLCSALSVFDCRSDSEEPRIQQDFVGELPLGVYYTNQGFAVLTGNALRFFDKDGNQTGIVDLTQKKLLSAYVEPSGAALTFGMEGLSGGNELCIYGLDGGQRAAYRFDSTLSDVMVTEECVWTISPGELTKCLLDGSGGKVYEVQTSFNRLLSDDGKLILFSENEAHYFDTAAEVDHELDS